MAGITHALVLMPERKPSMATNMVVGTRSRGGFSRQLARHLSRHSVGNLVGSVGKSDFGVGDDGGGGTM